MHSWQKQETEFLRLIKRNAHVSIATVQKMKMALRKIVPLLTMRMCFSLTPSLRLLVHSFIMKMSSDEDCQKCKIPTTFYCLVFTH